MNGQTRHALGWVGILSVGIMLSGCQEEKSTPKKTVDSPQEKTVPPTEAPDGSPRTPDAAMREMVQGLRANRPEVIWQAMPFGFQQDINGLVHEFARKMDPELWQKSFETWRTLTRLLKEKKSAILSHPELANLTDEQRNRLEQNWDGVVELLTILVHSELGDLKKLETFDMGRFLKKTGGRWLSELASLSESLGQDSLSGMLTGLEPKTLSADDQQAEMGWMTPEFSEPVSRFYVVKLENRWVPTGWATAWEQVQAWRAQLRQTPAEAFAQQSQEKLKTLASAEQTMQTLLATKTADEFHKTLDRELGESTVQEMASLIGTLSGAPAVTTTTPEPPPTENIPKSATDANSVTLLVTGAKGTADEDRIFDALQAALPGDVDVQFESTRTGLKVIVGPVTDFDQFRQNIKWGKVTQSNKDQLTLEIQMAP
ncbi:MAG: hypothetical protein KDA84_22115 [Planctomycetaceae bacterium]|nr:hypothetical protein [Planctomycetaceae bacterium]